MGYANLGALLMANGLAYDSDEGRAICAAITALMTGRAYRTSAEVAGALGPYERYEENRDPHNHVMRKHRHAAYEIDDSLVVDSALLGAARRAWDEAVEIGERNGYRNAQATVLAPTGTISFLMDCDTTGIEPDFSLVKFKELVGGGQMTIVNQTVPLALETLGYSAEEIEKIEAHLAENATIVGAPGLRDEHLPVFDVAVGERAIAAMGHVKMMAAAQPFLSGAISKTVNLPESVTVEDIAEVYTEAWKLGLKALAIYRDGSKTAQALKTDGGTKTADEASRPPRSSRRRPVRRRMPNERQSLTHKFSIGGHEGYITAGEYEDGIDRRDLPDRHREGGLDDQGHDERVRHGDLDRAPVRRAARDVRAQVRVRALRAGGDHPQPGDPVREVDARLHHALAGLPLRRRRPSRGARHPHRRDPRPQGGRGGGDARRHGGPARAGGRAGERRQWRQRRQRPLDAGRSTRRSRGAHRRAAGASRRSSRAWSWARPARVRRHDAANRLVLHVLELREQHRLRLS